MRLLKKLRKEINENWNDKFKELLEKELTDYQEEYCYNEEGELVLIKDKENSNDK